MVCLGSRAWHWFFLGSSKCSLPSLIVVPCHFFAYVTCLAHDGALRRALSYRFVMVLFGLLVSVHVHCVSSLIFQVDARIYFSIIVSTCFFKEHNLHKFTLAHESICSCHRKNILKCQKNSEQKFDVYLLIFYVRTPSFCGKPAFSVTCVKKTKKCREKPFLTLNFVFFTRDIKTVFFS